MEIGARVPSISGAGGAGTESGTAMAEEVVAVAAAADDLGFVARAPRPFLGGARWTGSGDICSRSMISLLILFSGNLYFPIFILYIVNMVLSKAVR